MTERAETLRRRFNMVVPMLELASQLVPGDWDNKAVAKVKEFIAKDWFVEFLAGVLDELSKKDGTVEKDDMFNVVREALTA